MANKNEKPFTKIHLTALRPEGWLKSQMECINALQRRLGSLPGLLNNGEWTEGETLPRFVRGLISLGAALGDKAVQEKAATFLSAIISSANEGGDFALNAYRSITPKIEAVKTILRYYEITDDANAVHILKKFFKMQFNTYSVSSNWYHSRARLLEEIPAIEAVYRDADLEWLRDLGEKLRDSSTNWFRLANKFPYSSPATAYVAPAAVKRVRKTVANYEKLGELNPKLKTITHDDIEKQWKRRAHRVTVETDAVSIAKAVKYPAAYGRFISDNELKNLSLKMYAALEKYHGTPLGMFTGDPNLAGCSPTRGIDVEATVELLESLCFVLGETADCDIADAIEKIIFNIIPAAYLDSAAAVEDALCVNQTGAAVKKINLAADLEHGTAYIAKTLSRGAVAIISAYPMFLETLCLKRDGELNFMTYAPARIETNINGSKLIIREETGYPFRNSIVFKVEHAETEQEIKINFRVPGGTSLQLISGGRVVAASSNAKTISVKCSLRTGSTFMLKLDIPLRAVEVTPKTVCLFKGNVLMAEKTPYKIFTDETQTAFSVNCIKKWNIAPVLVKKAVAGNRRLYDAERTEVNEIGDKPYNFERPPFQLYIRSKNVTNWNLDRDGAPIVVHQPVYSEESIERAFVPFGCTPVRIAVFPKCLK